MLSAITFWLRGQLPFLHSHPAPVWAAHHPRLSLLGFRVFVIGILFIYDVQNSCQLGYLCSVSKSRMLAIARASTIVPLGSYDLCVHVSVHVGSFEH